MKRTFNYILFPLSLIFIGFSFFTSIEKSHNQSPKSPNVETLQSGDTFKIVGLYALGKIPFNHGIPDSIQVRAVSQVAILEDKSIIMQVYNDSNVHCYPIINDDSCLTGTPKEIKLAEFDGSQLFDTVINFKLGDFGLKANDRIIVSGVAGDTMRLPPQKVYCYNVTEDQWSYTDDCLPDTAGAGFYGKTGSMLVSFRNKGTSNARISSIDYKFLDSIGGGFKPYKVVVYADNGSGKPGSLLHLSSALSSPSGTGTAQSVSYNLSSPISIAPDNRFYVGLRQTTSSNIKAAYQNENPVRKNAFFFMSPDTGGTWSDFSDSSKNFRLDITAKIQSAKLDLKLNFEACPNPSAISVLLRNSTPPYSLADSVNGTGGGNVSSFIYFGNSANGIPYYVVVKKVNAIETWSSTPLTFTSSNSSYDFTTSLSQAYGSNQRLSGGIPSIYQGDVNQDGFINLNDLTLTYNNASAFFTGPSTDFNCDGTTDLTDIALDFNNSNSFVQRVIP